MQLIGKMLQRIPQPALDRLIAWRVAYPNTPLKYLPLPVRAEVKHILQSALAPTGSTQDTIKHPASPAASAQPAVSPPVTTNGHTSAVYAPPRPRLNRGRSAPARNISNLSTVIGTEIATDREIGITEAAKRQSCYVIGVNGTGKTNIVKGMAISDAQAGRGFAVVEPHGQLVEEILGAVPRHRQNDIISLDIEDWENPFGLNIFEVPEPRNIRTEAATASFISHTFEVLWSAGFETPRLMQNLRAVTRTLIANPGAHFGDIPLLYGSEEVRARMLANVTNPQVLAFWEEYERMNFRDRRLFTESTLNKVTAFLDEPMISHILSQSKTTINFRYIMDNSKILLIKLSPQFEEASRLIGAVVIGKMLMTAFSRADTPEDERVQFNLYCDEFHRFASSDFATLISEARKFRISTILSHQTLTQLSEQNRASALASGNLIVFRVSGLDAPVLSSSFDTTPTEPYVIGEEAIRAPTNDTINFLLRKAHTNPDAMACNRYLEYLLHFAGLSVPLPPVHTPRDHYPNPRGNKAESVLEGMGDLVAVMFCNVLDRRKYRKTQGPVTDAQHCILVLNAYFSQVMLRRDPTLPIPQEVIALFSHREFLNGNVGDFCSSLQTVVSALAAAPILVETGQYRPRLQNRTYSDMEGEISNYIANQENYRAKVKLVNAGEYIIRTKPAPKGLTGDALAERIETIKRHCRALGYTRHYTEVQEEIRKRQEHLFGLGDTPDEETVDDGYDPDEPPPPGSFSLD